MIVLPRSRLDPAVHSQALVAATLAEKLVAQEASVSLMKAAEALFKQYIFHFIQTFA